MAQPMAPSSLSWKTLHGYGEDGSITNWKGLLPKSDADVLPEALRLELLKYGELAQATYDNFFKTVEHDDKGNVKLDEKFGDARYKERELLQKSLPTNSLAKDYTIVQYITATSGAFNLSKQSPLPSIVNFFQNSFPEAKYWVKPNWIGYIAISPDTEDGIDVAIVWRGTIMKTEWVSNVFGVDPVPWNPEQPDGPMVHHGFVEIYKDSNGKDQSRPQQVVQQCLRNLLDKHTVRSVTTTGHSLGGALSIISAADVAQFLRSYMQEHPNGTMPLVTAFPFAPPQPGDQKFRELLRSDLKVAVLATVNCRDVVPDVPNFSAQYAHPEVSKTGSRLDEFKRDIANLLTFGRGGPQAEKQAGYVPIGEYLVLDSSKSILFKHGRTAEDKRLNPMARFGLRHNMEQYLWLTATQFGGQPEPERPTDEVGVRDWALVNKGDNVLLGKFDFPPSWWPAPPGTPRKTGTGLWRVPVSAEV